MLSFGRNYLTRLVLPVNRAYFGTWKPIAYFGIERLIVRPSPVLDKQTVEELVIYNVVNVPRKTRRDSP